MPDTDTSNGSEGLTVDQAAAAFVKATTPPDVQQDQADDEELTGDATDDELQASEEDVSEGDDGEPGEDDQAEEEDGAEPETERGRYVAHNGRVKLPDGSESTVSDLISGNLKNADATKKWQEAADIRRNAETQSVTLKQREAQMDERDRYVISLVESIVPKAPSASMLETDPMGYLAQKESREQWLAHLNYLQSTEQQRQAAAKAEADQGRMTKADAEWEQAKAKVPEFKDEAKVKAFVEQSFKHGAAYGFSQQEVAQAIAEDHRQLLVLRDAMKWRSLQASKPKVQAKTEGRPTVLKGGKRLNPAERQQRGASAAVAQAQKSGRLEDATAAYIALHSKG